MAIKKDVEIILNNLENNSKLEHLNSYVGMDVLSSNGESAGTVKELITNEEKIVGIIISGKKTFFIEKRNFRLNKNNVIILKIDPIFIHIGKKVFDSQGKEIGSVSDISRKDNLNDFEHLVISRNLLSKNIKVPKVEVEVIGESIFLNKKYKNE